MFIHNAEVRTVEEKDSQISAKLLIKGNGFEISTEGRISYLYSELDTLVLFAEAVSKKLGTKSVAAPPTNSSLSTREIPLDVAAMPLITPSKSNVENIKSLFNTPWGKTPRTNAEITKALEVNAVPVALKDVAVYLARLVKRGYLRRVEKEGVYNYYKVPEQLNPVEKA
jgi:hypothetical protein